MAIEGIKEKDDLLKKELQRYQEITGINVSVHSPGDGNEKVPSFEDKYGANNVFDAAKNAPVFNNNASAAASSNGIGQNGENPNWNLYDAVVFNGPNPTVEVGGVNAQSGVQPTTSSALQQPNGSGYNNRQGGATEDSGGKPRFGAEALFEITDGGLSNKVPPEDNRFVTNTGEGMVAPEPSEETGEATGPNDSVPPNETLGPNYTPGVNNTPGANDTEPDITVEGNEPPVDNNKPPKTSNEIDKKQEEELLKKQEEDARKKLEEEQKPAA